MSIRSKSLTVLLLLVYLVSVSYARDMLYQEAPSLSAQVSAGTLPSVTDRLPETPRVIEPFEATGQYGGTLRFPYLSTNNPFDADLGFISSWEYLYTWSADGTEVVPNIAESVDINEDATVFTVHLRKGMRWSDGVPFTADDILFAMNDIFLDMYGMPQALTSQGKPVKTEKIDDWTVTFSFAASYGLFPENMAQWQFYSPTFYPKHWLSQYHAEYNPEGIDALLAANADLGFATWQDMFRYYAGGVSDIYRVWNRPTLNPWIMTAPRQEDGTFTLTRNPYYWKVDTAGNQLPYIDEIAVSPVPDFETLVLRELEGAFDIMSTTDLEDLGLFRDSSETSGLTVYFSESDSSNTASIHFNLTSKDAEKRALFNTKNFRVGMSYAINRQEIIDLVFYGIGTPRQLAPMESSPLYNEQMAQQYSDYDPGLANQSLDQAGLDQRDEEGYRMLNGERLTLELVYADPPYALGWPQVVTLLAGYWREAGIDVVVTEVTMDELINRRNTNTFDVTIFTGDGGTGITPILDARNYVPIGYFSWFGMGWANWSVNRNDPTAVEPPDHIKQLVADYNAVVAEPNPDTRIEMMSGLIQTLADDFYVLGISNPPPYYTLLNASIKNFPETWINGFPTGKLSITRPEQWYFAQ